MFRNVCWCCTPDLSSGMKILVSESDFETTDRSDVLSGFGHCQDGKTATFEQQEEGHMPFLNTLLILSNDRTP